MFGENVENPMDASTGEWLRSHSQSREGPVTPLCGAHFECEGEEIKVWRTSVETDAFENIEPGKVLECSENGILVKAGIGGMRLHEIEPSISIRVGEYL